MVLINYCLNDWAAPFFLPAEEGGGIVEKSVLFVYPQPLDPTGQQHIRQMTEAAGIRYVDLYAPFAEYYRTHDLSGIEALAVKKGDMHPNPEGHRLIAAALNPVLTSLLAR